MIVPWDPQFVRPAAGRSKTVRTTYNYRRPHGGLDGQTPHERFKQKAESRMHATAVSCSGDDVLPVVRLRVAFGLRRPWLIDATVAGAQTRDKNAQTPGPPRCPCYNRRSALRRTLVIMVRAAIWGSPVSDLLGVAMAVGQGAGEGRVFLPGCLVRLDKQSVVTGAPVRRAAEDFGVGLAEVRNAWGSGRVEITWPRQTVHRVANCGVIAKALAAESR
jgi:hypothetical protein